jgi:hypothetical protein
MKNMREVHDKIVESIEKQTRAKWRASLDKFNEFSSHILNNDYMKLIGEVS